MQHKYVNIAIFVYYGKTRFGAELEQFELLIFGGDIIFILLSFCYDLFATKRHWIRFSFKNI